jgi:hypothetical protein
MKRIATVGAIVTAFAAAPAVAAAGNVTHVKLQNHKPEVVKVEIVKVQRAQAAVTLQRHVAQVATAQRFSVLMRAHVR